jgi:hypothetical protein
MNAIKNHSPSEIIRVNLWIRKSSVRKPEARLMALKRRLLAPQLPQLREAFSQNESFRRKPSVEILAWPSGRCVNLWTKKLPHGSPPCKSVPIRGQKKTSARKPIRDNPCKSVDKKSSARKPSVLIRGNLGKKKNFRKEARISAYGVEKEVFSPQTPRGGL